MNFRKKFLIIFGIIYLILASFIFFGLKKYSQKKFTPEKIKILTDQVSPLRDKTDDLCKYKLLGDPAVKDQYIKLNFWCTNNKNARSTIALTAIENKTIKGVLQEYARIIGFDFNILKEKKWYCLIDNKEISESDFNKNIKPTSSIDCFENKNLYHYD